MSQHQVSCHNVKSMGDPNSHWQEMNDSVSMGAVLSQYGSYRVTVNMWRVCSVLCEFWHVGLSYNRTKEMHCRYVTPLFNKEGGEWL